MNEQRKPASEVTPEYEDSGLFKSDLIQINVELVPMFGRNSRQDIVIKGFVAGGGAIDVVFAGRRKAEVKPLMARLQAMMNQTRRQMKPEANELLNADKIRHAVRIHGSWRPRFRCDDQGWQTREHQLYAARWLVADKNGQSTIFGEMPRR